MMIKISEIKVTPIKPNKTLKAFCSFLVDECLYVGDIALHYRPQEQRDPYWLVYPSKVLFNGKIINTVHPINRETELFITRAVVKRDGRAWHVGTHKEWLDDVMYDRGEKI